MKIIAGSKVVETAARAKTAVAKQAKRNVARAHHLKQQAAEQKKKSGGSSKISAAEKMEKISSFLFGKMEDNALFYPTDNDLEATRSIYEDLEGTLSSLIDDSDDGDVDAKKAAGYFKLFNGEEKKLQKELAMLNKKSLARMKAYSKLSEAIKKIK